MEERKRRRRKLWAKKTLLAFLVTHSVLHIQFISSCRKAALSLSKKRVFIWWLNITVNKNNPLLNQSRQSLKQQWYCSHCSSRLVESALQEIQSRSRNLIKVTDLQQSFSSVTPHNNANWENVSRIRRNYAQHTTVGEVVVALLILSICIEANGKNNHIVLQ